jgi:tetratricopeptide (TPR) repeat protein
MVGAAGQTKGRAATLKVTGAEPLSFVIVDGIRHGRTDARGSRVVATIPAGRHSVVVRQPGFADFSQTVTFAAGRTANVTPKRVPTTDPSELAFQRAEALAADGKNADAAAAYQEAVATRGAPYVAAQIGLARALLAARKTDEATTAITAAIDANARNAEAHAVLGNVLRERGLPEDAAAEYRKAISLAGGSSPEGHTGLAIVYDEHGDREKAVAEFRTAIAQNQDAEPVLYQLLGGTLEHLDRKKEAVAAYERFLELAPTHPLASAVRSVLEQLRAQTPAEEEGDVNPYAPK